MNSKLLLLAKLLVCVFFLQACIEPYALDLKLTQKVLIVDGSITDQPGDQFVSIKTSQPALSSTTIFAVKDARVEVIVDDKDVVPLVDRNKNGEYYFPANYQIKYDTKYKLTIKTNDGNTYESSQESMVRGPKIDSLYAVYKSEAVNFGTNKFPGHFLFLDTKDPVGIKNNYFWTWKLWEKQSVCETCFNSRYNYDARSRSWGCTPFDPNLLDPLDYNCSTSCWEVFNSTELNVIKDANSDGRPIIGRLIAKIPFYQYSGALVEVRQQSVSPVAFKYLSLLIEQGQNTGTLADTPPAALVGNIKNINKPEESVGGIFMVSSTQVKRLWLNRQDVPKSISAFGLLGGRSINNEVSADPARPPLAPCVKSRTRTTEQPSGWLN